MASHVALAETMKLLEEYRAKSSSVLVSFSGGKDSLVVADLCSKVFDHVEAFHMYLLPALHCVEKDLEVGRQLWDLNIRQYPHWALYKSFKSGAFCNPSADFDDLPEVSYRDVLNVAMADSGIDIVAHGGKRADSIWRRRNMSQLKQYGDVMHPIAGWHKIDVIAYLRSRGIPVPKMQGDEKGACGGVGLTAPSICWLHDNWPGDYDRLREVWPYVDAVIQRRKWYGIGD